MLALRLPLVSLAPLKKQREVKMLPALCLVLLCSRSAVNQQCGNTAGTCGRGLVCQASCSTRTGGSSSGGGRCAPASAAAAASPPSMCPGCAIAASVCSSGVVNATDFAISHIDAQSNSLNSLQLVRPVSATSQVVAGIKYTLTFMAGVSECAKPRAGGAARLCSTPVHADAAHEYTATVWDQPWRTPRYVLQHWELPQAAHTCNCPPSLAVYKCSLGHFEQLAARCASHTASHPPPRCFGCPVPARADDAAVLAAAQAALHLAASNDSGLSLPAAFLSSARGSPPLPSMQVINATAQTVSGHMFHAFVLLRRPMSPPPAPHGGIGPAWTWGGMEKPAGTQDMGSWQQLAYTPEQQARLGVDEDGIAQAVVSLCELQVWQRPWHTPPYALRRFDCSPPRGKESTGAVAVTSTQGHQSRNTHNRHGADPLVDYSAVIGYGVLGCVAATGVALVLVHYRRRATRARGMSRLTEEEEVGAPVPASELVPHQPTGHEREV